MFEQPPQPNENMSEEEMEQRLQDYLLKHPDVETNPAPETISSSNESMSEEEMEERLQDYLLKHPDVETNPAPEAISSSVEKFKGLIAQFETTFNLKTLHAITNSEEAKVSRERNDAKQALIPIFDAMNFFKGSLSERQYAALKSEYKRLSQAVGMIHKGVVDHTR